jgi:hypothetical protein
MPTANGGIRNAAQARRVWMKLLHPEIPRTFASSSLEGDPVVSCAPKPPVGKIAQRVAGQLFSEFSAVFDRFAQRL